MANQGKITAAHKANLRKLPGAMGPKASAFWKNSYNLDPFMVEMAASPLVWTGCKYKTAFDQQSSASFSDYNSKFGRKQSQRSVQAMAKKAMKLHHREGISLKQAWKRVKSGKSGKNKQKVSRKQKKASSLAKKAMKLHHREGITLKQAWRRVR